MKILNYETDQRVPIGSHLKVLPADIVAFMGLVNYSEVYLANGKKIIVATHLKILESRFFPHGFFRVHKSMIINTEYLLDKNPSTPSGLKLKNNLPVMASRRKFESFRSHNIQKYGIDMPVAG